MATPIIQNLHDTNTVHNLHFFNRSGKKCLKVVKSGKTMRIFVKSLEIKGWQAS